MSSGEGEAVEDERPRAAFGAAFSYHQPAPVSGFQAWGVPLGLSPPDLLLTGFLQQGPGCFFVLPPEIPSKPRISRERFNIWARATFPDVLVASLASGWSKGM